MMIANSIRIRHGTSRGILIISFFIYSITSFTPLFSQSDCKQALTNMLAEARLMRQALKDGGIYEPGVWRNFMPSEYRKWLGKKNITKAFNAGPDVWIETGYKPFGDTLFMRGASGARTHVSLKEADGVAEARTILDGDEETNANMHYFQSQHVAYGSSIRILPKSSLEKMINSARDFANPLAVIGKFSVAPGFFLGDRNDEPEKMIFLSKPGTFYRGTQVSRMALLLPIRDELIHQWAEHYVALSEGIEINPVSRGGIFLSQLKKLLSEKAPDSAFVELYNAYKIKDADTAGLSSVYSR